MGYRIDPDGVIIRDDEEKVNASKDGLGKWPKLFIIVGLLLLIMGLLYRLLVYASYLEVKGTRFSDNGGSATIPVETDAFFVSLVVYGDDWYSISKSGKDIVIKLKENNEPYERQMSFAVLTGVIYDLCKIRKEVTITQAGKGATYIKTSLESIDLVSSNRASLQVLVDTDGDTWYVASQPIWVDCDVRGKMLKIVVEKNEGGKRDGLIEVNSYGQQAKIWISQEGKPKQVTQIPITPISNADGSASLSKPTNELAFSNPSRYPVQYYSTSNTQSLSGFVVVDKELSANEVDALLSSNHGWRLVTREELIFLYQNYEYALPSIGEGYWYFKGNILGGGYDLSSLSFNNTSNHDSDQYRNRVVFVK